MHSILLNEFYALASMTGRSLGGEFTEECVLNGFDSSLLLYTPP